MIVVVTGMVGVDKKNYLDSVVELCRGRGKNVEIANVGEMMYKEALDIPPGKILDISLKRLQSLRRCVFKDIIARSKQVEHLIVNTHATFRWRHGLFPAVDFDQMRQLDADMYVCIIDGADVLHVRLTEEHHIRHSLKDILVWREEEILGTEMLAAGVSQTSKPFYALARGCESDTSETFYKLLFEPHRRRVYLSFPMTHVVDMPEVQREIMQFRKTMTQHFIGFDPGDLEEAYLPVYARKAQKAGNSHIELKVLGRDVKFDLKEVLQVERDVNSQIYARDFMLIDQADMIISYIPAGPDGRALLSSGVERELQHAHEAGREEYVIWTSKHDPSVFVTQTATVFRSTQEAVEYFKAKGMIQK